MSEICYILLIISHSVSRQTVFCHAKNQRLEHTAATHHPKFLIHSLIVFHSQLGETIRIHRLLIIQLCFKI